MAVSRPLQVDLSKEDDLRRLAATLVACSVRVVSHHLDGLLRVTTPGVLQPVPARVRCVSSSTDLHHPGKPESGGERSAFPAARAPFEEPSSSTGGNASRHCRYPHEVAARPVQTRRPYLAAWPSTGRCSADNSGPSRSPLPVCAMTHVLPWVSIPATPRTPKCL